ncbi:enolase family protein [Tritrichomonas foetus]|uniref:phosphopyruvate hydratase n=1 Tax=Tritrichomonas foetus TaxID=1144522 RepID=A0A1J4KD25_9EUKA|nr:enolase family protein [Tritrichomonas foetus]|eukprot:OHT07341.1 enolase family protein [Tritrichomonas foetus]
MSEEIDQSEEQINETENRKELVAEYLEYHQIREALDQSVNELFESRPVDVCGVLSQIMIRRANPPVIDHLKGREVLDSRGNPTVEVDVYVKYLGEVSLAARSSAPSGASTGSNEARELRDSSSPRYFGKGTQQAVNNVNEILSPALENQELNNLQALDNIISQADGTELKEKVGGNATTATSFALAEAGAEMSEIQLFEYLAKQYYGEENVPEKFRLPTPFFNILNGGKHAGGNLKIQEFMISPRVDMPFPEQLRMAAEVYHKLGGILAKEFGVSARNLGDEGGFAPPLNSPEQAISVIEKAIQVAGYEPGHDIRIALDAAASEFYNSQTKMYEIEVGMNKSGDDMVEYWKELIEKHPSIISIEDPLDEKDYDTWIKLNDAIGDRIQLVGDDLYTTNPNTIEKGLEGKWCNALLLKVNQIGTISEAMKAARLILDAGQNVMVSHRSGETCNSVIADLAVAIGAQAIKTGSTARGERIQKYTRLLQIYDYLKENNLLII